MVCCIHFPKDSTNKGYELISNTEGLHPKAHHCRAVAALIVAFVLICGIGVFGILSLIQSYGVIISQSAWFVDVTSFLQSMPCSWPLWSMALWGPTVGLLTARWSILTIIAENTRVEEEKNALLQQYLCKNSSFLWNRQEDNT